MVDTFKTKILKFFAKDYYKLIEDKEKILDQEKSEIELKINQRVAEIVSHMNPLEVFLAEHNVILSEYYERVEDRLSEQSKLSIAMWAWGQKRDPHMQRMMDWIINTAGNQMLKSPARSNEERGEVLLWGKAQIANILLLKKELGRLASIYERHLNPDKDFDENLPVDY